MTDLADALRADGHGDLAAALEAKELVGRLRQSGRDDLADALEAGEPLGTPTRGTEPEAEQQAGPVSAEQQFGQMLLGINAAQSPSLEFGNWAEEAAGNGGVAQAPQGRGAGSRQHQGSPASPRRSRAPCRASSHAPMGGDGPPDRQKGEGDASRQPTRSVHPALLRRKKNGAVAGEKR